MNSSKTNEFKVSDKIRRVYVGYCDMPLGSVWEVSAITNEAKIQVSGQKGVSWLSKNFELVEDSVGKDNKESSTSSKFVSTCG